MKIICTYHQSGYLAGLSLVANYCGYQYIFWSPEHKSCADMIAETNPNILICFVADCTDELLTLLPKSTKLIVIGDIATSNRIDLMLSECLSGDRVLQIKHVGNSMVYRPLGDNPWYTTDIVLFTDWLNKDEILEILANNADAQIKIFGDKFNHPYYLGQLTDRQRAAALSNAKISYINTPAQKYNINLCGCDEYIIGQDKDATQIIKKGQIALQNTYFQQWIHIADKLGIDTSTLKQKKEQYELRYFSHLLK